MRPNTVQPTLKQRPAGQFSSRNVARAELRFYLKNGKQYEFQDFPVDVLCNGRNVQVLLLRQSHSKRKSKPKWKPLLFELSPSRTLGIKGIVRNNGKRKEDRSTYEVHFRKSEGYPLAFAKSVLRMNNWSSNELLNQFKKVALPMAIKRMIKSRKDVEAAILNGEVIMIPMSVEDDGKLGKMFEEIFGPLHYVRI